MRPKNELSYHICLKRTGKVLRHHLAVLVLRVGLRPRRLQQQQCYMDALMDQHSSNRAIGRSAYSNTITYVYI